jgi:hypothetical protein
MTAPRIDGNCMECFRTGEHFFCGVRRLFHQLHVPPQEQIILMSMANKKRIDCKSFKIILSKIVTLKIEQL